MHQEVYSIQIEFSPAEVGFEQALLVRLRSQGILNTASHRVEIGRRRVRQSAPLRRTPHVFDRVQLRRVGRKAMEPNPRAADCLQEALGLTVGAEVVPHNVQLSPQIAPKVIEKPDEILGFGIMVQEPEKHSHSPALRR
jgi:hypothetical protein